MAEDEKVRLSVDAVLEGGSIAKLTEELASGIAKATTEGGKRSQEQFGKYIAAAMDAGTSGWNPEGTGKKFTKMMEKAKAYQIEIVRLTEKGDTVRAKFLERERKKEMVQLQRVAGRRKAAYQEISKLEASAMDERVDAYTSKMERGISGIFAGDIGGLFKGAGKGMQQRGDAAAQKGKDVNASKTQKMMGTLGKGMAGMGAMMMTVGAVAGMVMMLIKAFISLDDKIKDMNKSIVGTATAADFGFGGADATASGFGAKLEEIRGSILDSAKDWEGWRQSSESMFKVLGAMNEMNVTFAEMDKMILDTSNHLNSYADISIRAVAYGKLLGVESQQMGADMAKMANEFGVGYDVIANGLHAVHKEAMLSGFSTKRFYSTVLEVTSGLGAYNIRLEEAGALLGALDSAGGEVQGAAGFQQVAGQNQFQGMGVMEALEKILVTGTQRVASIFADEASSKASLLFTQLNENQQKQFADKFNLDASSARAFGESFAKKAPGQKAVRDFLASIMDPDDKKAGEKMQTAQQASGLAAAGKGSKSAIIQSFSDLGGASRMRFAMSMPKFLKGKWASLTALMEDEGEEAIAGMAAAQAAMGMDRDQLKKFSRLIASMESGFKDVKTKGKGAAVGTVITGSQGNFRKTEGGYERVELDDKGKFVKSLSGSFKTIDGYLDSMNDYIEGEQKVIDADLDAAKAMVDEVDKLSTVLEENIAAILNDIYSTLLKLWYYISGDQDARDKMKGNRDAFERKIKMWTSENKEEQKQARGDMKAATNPAEKEAAATRLKTSKGRGAMLENMERAADTLDPTKFNDGKEYMDAVFKAAKVDPSLFKKAQGEDSSRQSKDLPTKQKKKSRRKGQEDQDLGEDQGGGEMDWGPAIAKLHKLAESTGWETDLIGETPMETQWRNMEEIFKDDILSQVSKDDRGMFETLWSKLKSDYDAYPFTDDENQDFLLGTFMKGGMRDTVITPLEQALVTGDFTTNANRYVFPEADDMYVPSGGQPILLNSQDEFLAMKKGGAIDSAMGGGGGRGGTTVINNFDGPVTEALVRKAVGEGILMAQGKPFA